MKMTTTFIQSHPPDEPISDKPCPPALIDEYIINDADRANNNVGSVIYDSVDVSPFYENISGDYYIDENLLIEVPLPSQ